MDKINEVAGRYFSDSSIIDNKEMTGIKIDMNFSFDSQLYNINDEIMVDFPELSNDNSFNFLDLIQSSMQNNTDGFKFDEWIPIPGMTSSKYIPKVLALQAAG